MKKKTDIQAISNELSEGSVFFPRNQERQASPTSQLVPVQEHPVPLVPPVRVVPPVPPQKRIMKQRHPFDIYQDQYVMLQQLAAEERKAGGVGSMSAMVREALDKLIAERRKK